MRCNLAGLLFSVLGGLAIALLQGCSDESRSFELANENRALAVTEIDATLLESQSMAEPVPLPLAAAQVLEAQIQPTRVAETIKISLAEVRMATLANNLDLQVQLVNPAIARQAVDAERAKFEAVFNFAGSFEDQRSPAFNGRNQSYSAGVTQPLITGGTISLTAPFTQSDSAVPPYEAGLQFSVSQPLLRNAGIDANMYSIRASESNRQIVDAQTKLEAIRILANADRGYWMLYAAIGELRVNQQVYDLGLKQIDQAKKRVAAQASPGIEIERAESGAATALAGIILSQTQVTRAARELKRIMHRSDLPVESTATLIPITQPDPRGLSLSPQSLTNHALANRMEMLQLELKLALDMRTIDYERNQALPLFVLEYNYDLNRFANRGDQVLQFGHGSRLPDWTLQLTAQIPIGNQAARSQLREAILERQQRLATKEQQQTAITQEVYDAVDQFNQNWQRILAARDEAILAGRTYEGELHQFELGVRTSTDVLNAAQRLADAQLREVEALTDFEISRVDIAFATGTLLGNERVILVGRR